MNKKQILLFSIALDNQMPTEEPGLNSICAYLKKNDYDVYISIFEKHIIDKDLLSLDPFLIGISVYNDTISYAKELCGILKKIYPEAKICLGGYAPTYYYDEVFEMISEFDYIIYGEGEVAFLNLANCISNQGDISKVGNLIYKDLGKIVKTQKLELIEDLDSIPFADRYIATSKKYELIDRYLLTSRGCSRNCAFCCNNQHWKRKPCNWRGNSINYVINEINTLVNEHKIRTFEIIDNSFEEPFPYFTRTDQFTAELIKRKIYISYGISLRAESISNVKDEQFDQLINSGLAYIFLGVESFDTNDLKLYQKTANLEQNVYAINYITKKEVALDIGFINFNPYTSKESLIHNINYLEKCDFALPQYFLTFLMILRGTDFYDKMRKKGLINYSNEKELDPQIYIDPQIKIFAKNMKELRSNIQNTSQMRLCLLLIFEEGKLRKMQRLLKIIGLYDEKTDEKYQAAHQLIRKIRREKNLIYAQIFKSSINNLEHVKLEILIDEIKKQNSNDENYINEIRNIMFSLSSKYERVMNKYERSL